MTAGNNGTPDPGTDDPFAYLYRQEGADPAAGQTAATAPQPGVPRTSYNQVRAVGERRPAPGQGQGQVQQQPAYGYPPQQFQEQPYGATQQLPHQQQPGYSPGLGSGYGSGSGRAGGHGGGSGRGPNSKGLLIGAIAVVAAVSIGIGVAMANGSGDEANAKATTSPSTTAGASGGSDGSSQPSSSASSSADTTTGLGTVDAAAQALSGGAEKSTEHAKALAAGGTYVDHMTTAGATVTWTVDMSKAGSYRLYVRYANAEKDAATATTVVNGTALSYKMSLKNYGTEGNWDSWFKSYQTVNLTKGSNTIALTCGDGDACHFNLDQLALTEGSEPAGW